MEPAVDLSGRWVGLLVHFPSATAVTLTLTLEGAAIAGSYEMLNNSPKDYGTLSGSYSGDSISLKLPGADSHGPMTFQGTIVEESGKQLIYGVIPLPGATIPFATFSAFRLTDQSPIVFSGAWNAREFGRE